MVSFTKRKRTIYPSAHRTTSLQTVVFVTFAGLVCLLVSYQMAQTLPTGKSDIVKGNSNMEAKIKNRPEAVVGEVKDAADEKAEEEANAAATEKTKQMTTEGARLKVNETTAAATEEEGAKLKGKKESGLDAAMKTCELRNLSSYNVGAQYSKNLISSMAKNNCIGFKCIPNSIEDCDNALPTNYDGPDPPCCTHVLRDMARKFDETMCTLGLDYMASFGTLLGFIRSDRIIPWTADNDYIISESTANAMVDLWDANTTGLAYMFQDIPRMCVTGTFAEGKLIKWEQAPESRSLWNAGSPYIDLYVGKNYTHDRYMPKIALTSRRFMGIPIPYIDFYAGKHTLYNRFKLLLCDHNISHIWPTQRMQVYNKTFTQNIPANPEHVLRRVYGKYWRVPDAGEKQHGQATCRPLVP